MFSRSLMIAAVSAYVSIVTPALAQKTISNCGAGQQALGHHAMLAASSLTKRGSFDAALHVLQSNLSNLGSGCSIRAAMLTEKAGIDLRLGQVHEAAQAGTKALDLEYGDNTSQARERGMDEYILASADAAEGQNTKAEREYLLAAQTLSKAGASEAINVARIYSDLAVLYVRSGDVRSAELYMQKALHSERSAPNPDKLEQFARLDALAHLEYLKGRLSDALRTTKELIGSYGTDSSIDATLRAHLYRDYAQLCVSTHKFDEGIEYLNHSLDLQLKGSGAPPQELAFSWAFLARIHILRKQFDAAEAALIKAQNRIQPFQHDFPEDAAIVAETYGILLNLESRWTEARAQLQLARQLAGSAPDLGLMKLEDLQALAYVDHRLHKKREEKQVRVELKSLRARGRSAWKPDTVDVLTLAENHQAPQR